MAPQRARLLEQLPSATSAEVAAGGEGVPPRQARSGAATSG
jgi:hypothetical protein